MSEPAEANIGDQDGNPYRPGVAAPEASESYSGLRYFDTKYARPIKFAVSQQLGLAFLAALSLDHGRMAKRMAVAILAYWLCFCLIGARRPSNPTPTDLALIKWGFLVIAFLFLVASAP